MIKEDFLYYLWNLKRFDLSDLKTIDGIDIVIEKSGFRNSGSGPDFIEAKIRIGETVWFGSVEIHVFSSDWDKHAHEIDPAYNNVILHVVYEYDKNVKTQSGNVLPVLELKNRISKSDLKNYKLLRFSKDWIPCEKQISNVRKISKDMALERMIIDRMLRKSSKMKEYLSSTTNDWSESFYVFLSSYFGMNTNAYAFERLAVSLPLNLISKENNSLLKIESLLFGQAGFLNQDCKDEYPKILKDEYNHLKSKYNLVQNPISIWNFGKLRPQNFPAIRIAELAAMLHKNLIFFDKIIQIESLEEIRKIFRIDTSEYWESHYTFDILSTKKRKNIGANSIDILIINAVLPAIFLYGHETAQFNYKELALKLLENIPREKNSVVDKWKELGFYIQNAYDSQALLELKKNNCDLHKCLDCPIGNDIMNHNN
jgi:hypothetical protein